MHWIGVYAMFTMIMSSWEIYSASPSLPFTVPAWATLGGWLAGGVAWHLSAMWLLFADGVAYLAYGLISGHVRTNLGWPQASEIRRDLKQVLRGQLGHRLGSYNAIQRLLYILVIIAIVFAVTSGLAIWKPVQLGWLTNLLGGYPTARLIHLGLMTAIVAFIVVHVALVGIFPRTLVSMLVSVPAEKEFHEPGA